MSEKKNFSSKLKPKVLNKAKKKLSDEEIEAAVEKEAKPVEEKRIKKKEKEPSRRFQMRIPISMYDRMEAVANRVGIPMASVAKRAIMKEIELIEKE